MCPSADLLVIDDFLMPVGASDRLRQEKKEIRAGKGAEEKREDNERISTCMFVGMQSYN